MALPKPKDKKTSADKKPTALKQPSRNRSTAAKEILESEEEVKKIRVNFLCEEQKKFDFQDAVRKVTKKNDMSAVLVAFMEDYIEKAKHLDK